MTVANPIHHRIAEHKLHAQSLRLWVLELLAWFAGWAGQARVPRNDALVKNARAWLRTEMAKTRKEIREILFLLVMAHLPWRKKDKLPTMRPRNVAVGFRRVARKLDMLRVYLRGIRLKTLDDMRDVLDDVDRYVARALKRIPKRGVAFFTSSRLRRLQWRLFASRLRRLLMPPTRHKCPRVGPRTSGPHSLLRSRKILRSRASRACGPPAVA